MRDVGDCKYLEDNSIQEGQEVNTDAVAMFANPYLRKKNDVKSKVLDVMADAVAAEIVTGACYDADKGIDLHVGAVRPV